MSLDNTLTQLKNRPILVVGVVATLIVFMALPSMSMSSSIPEELTVAGKGIIQPADVGEGDYNDDKDPIDFGPEVVPGNESDFSPETVGRTWGESKSQFIYLVGVEGAGHHGVAPLLNRMAEFADMEFHMRDREVRRSLLTHNVPRLSRAYKTIERASKAKQIVLEDNSFPSGHFSRQASLAGIKRNAHYNLEWIVKTTQSVGRDVKLLLLTRPFVNQVWSHKSWDGGFKGHATTLARYMAYIDKEFSVINQDKIWARIDYTWFSDELCPSIVPKLADFLQWPSPKDPVKFCSKTPFHISSKVPQLDDSEKAFVENLQKKYKSSWGVYERPDKGLITV